MFSISTSNAVEVSRLEPAISQPSIESIDIRTDTDSLCQPCQPSMQLVVSNSISIDAPSSSSRRQLTRMDSEQAIRSFLEGTTSNKALP